MLRIGDGRAVARTRPSQALGVPVSLPRLGGEVWACVTSHERVCESACVEMRERESECGAGPAGMRRRACWNDSLLRGASEIGAGEGTEGEGAWQKEGGSR